MIKHTIANEEYTSVSGAAEYLGVGIQTLHRYIKEGKIKPLKISNRKWYISVTQLKEITNNGN